MTPLASVRSSWAKRSTEPLHERRIDSQVTATSAALSAYGMEADTALGRRRSSSHFIQHTSLIRAQFCVAKDSPTVGSGHEQVDLALFVLAKRPNGPVTVFDRTILDDSTQFRIVAERQEFAV